LAAFVFSLSKPFMSYFALFATTDALPFSVRCALALYACPQAVANAVCEFHQFTAIVQRVVGVDARSGKLPPPDTAAAPTPLQEFARH